ncbi:chromosomal replication initiator protein DnaA, partial [Acholeplasma sp. OttesenSCG-928-E16]|nr:chromosomal replication initiator protein DnaA [Acholeplasma sp. OttesenSCG-928-E16]
KNGLIYIVVPNEFIRGRINRLYANRINDLIPKYYQKEPLRFKFITESEVPNDDDTINRERIIETTYRSGNIKASYRFDNFVVGDSNFFAFRTANLVADQLGSIANPLYIFGDVGLGKTHLMQAIGNYVLDKDVSMKVLYVQASTFVEDFTRLVRKDKVDQTKMDLFYDKYRDVDVLLIDDVQILSDKTQTQMEFFKLYELLFQQNKQIVITSDQPASDLKGFITRLTSRFQQGMTVNIGVPNLEHRISILKSKMKADYKEDQYLSDEVLEFIAESVPTNIRELYGALNTLVNFCLITNCEPSIEIAKEALEHLLKTRKKSKSISENNYDKIQSVVADYFQISLDDLIGPKRSSQYVKARHIAMYLIKMNYNITYKTIGELFGNRDHSTVLAAIEKIEYELRTDEQLKTVCETIAKKLKLHT